MAQDKVNDRVFRIIVIGRISTEDVVDRPPTVQAGRYPAVAVVAGVTARPLDPLDFITLRVVHKGEVRVAVALARIMLQTSVIQPGPDPVLEMKLLVRAADALDQGGPLHSVAAGHEGIHATGGASRSQRYVPFVSR